MPGSSCSWCVSPNRQAAEEAIAAGVTVAKTARDYDLSRDQWKHHRHHDELPRLRVEILADGGGPYTVIPRLEHLLIDVAAAKQKWQNKPSTVVQLLRLERDVLGDVAKLRGEFPRRHSMEVGEWEEWHRVVEALMPFTKAMRAVSLALTNGERS